jgi:hypothetical protein
MSDIKYRQWFSVTVFVFSAVESGFEISVNVSTAKCVIYTATLLSSSSKYNTAACLHCEHAPSMKYQHRRLLHREGSCWANVRTYIATDAQPFARRVCPRFHRAIASSEGSTVLLQEGSRLPHARTWSAPDAAGCCARVRHGFGRGNPGKPEWDSFPSWYV